MKRWFITVDWCDQGKRGIFADKQGNCMVQDKQHTIDEIENSLGIFSMILSPKSEEMSIDEVSTYKWWIPLGEYSNEWGIVLPKEDS